MFPSNTQVSFSIFQMFGENHINILIGRAEPTIKCCDSISGKIIRNHVIRFFCTEICMSNQSCWYRYWIHIKILGTGSWDETHAKIELLGFYTNNYKTRKQRDDNCFHIFNICFYEQKTYIYIREKVNRM